MYGKPAEVLNKRGDRREQVKQAPSDDHSKVLPAAAVRRGVNVHAFVEAPDGVYVERQDKDRGTLPGRAVVRRSQGHSCNTQDCRCGRRRDCVRDDIEQRVVGKQPEHWGERGGAQEGHDDKFGKNVHV